MLKRVAYFIIIGLFLTSTSVMAYQNTSDNCKRPGDYYCDIPATPEPRHNAKELAYCGNTYVYITKEDKEKLNRYLKHYRNMVLKVNGEYIDSPCF